MDLIGGEIPAKHARAAAAAGEDRLSALHDDILVLILLRLRNAAAAGRTSVLSHRWRRLWALLPELCFPVGPPPGLIASALASHEAPLRHLLVGTVGATPESVAAWLPVAARRLSGDLVYSNLAPGDEEAKGAAERGAFELPCFENATGVALDLGFLGLAVPPAGVFPRLTELTLCHVSFHGPCELGDAVSSPRCPSLQILSVCNCRGMVDLAIHSESVLEVELQHLDKLQQLDIEGSRLKQLKLVNCLAHGEPVASISAPQMSILEWRDWYDPRSVYLADMENLQCLIPGFILVYGTDDLIIYNRARLSLLQRFKVIGFLVISLGYVWDIAGYRYLMQDMTSLPDVHSLHLMVLANGHSFGASSFHVLRFCISIRRLKVVLSGPSVPEVKLFIVCPVLELPGNLQSIWLISKAQPTCPSGCICDQPPDWKTEELLLNHLCEVEISRLRGYEHEVAFVQRLFHWAPAIKKMIIIFDGIVTRSMAKELHQMLRNFSVRNMHGILHVSG